MMVLSSIKKPLDFAPLIRVQNIKQKEPESLCGSPGLLIHLRVEMIDPSLSALFSCPPLQLFGQVAPSLGSIPLHKRNY